MRSRQRSLLSGFFGPDDFEIITNLKTAPRFVCDGGHILTLSIVFKPEVKKKKNCAFFAILFVLNPIDTWDAIYGW